MMPPPPSGSELGSVVPMRMMSGEKQLAVAKRTASLQARSLSSKEKDAIQRRRDAVSQRRKSALLRAERLAGGNTELQARLKMRRAALQEADLPTGESSAAGELSAGGDDHASTSSGSNRLPPHPNIAVPEMKRRRRSRLTLSAMACALRAISQEEPAGEAQNEDVESAGGAVGSLSPRFSVGGLGHRRTSRGMKRSVTGAPRESLDSSITGARDSIGPDVGCKAMLSRAARTVSRGACGDDDSDDAPHLTASESTADSLSAAFPFRQRRKALVPTQVHSEDAGAVTSEIDSGFETVSTLSRAVSEASFLPPPPDRPVRRPRRAARRP